jgi:hypothetical protein
MSNHNYLLIICLHSVLAYVEIQFEDSRFLIVYM